MEHPSPSAPTTTGGPIIAPIAGGMAGASFGLGFFSSVVFWWTPFSSILATVGLVLGIISMARKVRGPRGENIALAGTAMCAASLSITLTLNQVLRYLQWDKFW